jgi:competence protein ComEC
VSYTEGRRELRIAARAAEAQPMRLSSGQVLRDGALRLEVLWPPPAQRAASIPGADPNARSLVVLARWHRFEALLTGDAEAELAPVDPGRIDLLKVAHHGSEDPGLPALLERTDPRLALISVGADNPYGHPHPATLSALEEAGIPTLRIDELGDIDIEIGAGTMRLVR